jgi:hypothetical protein
MGKEMKFPNEIWINDEDKQWDNGHDPDMSRFNQARYIHESRVPIYCGGTMEEKKDELITQLQNALSVRDSQLKDLVQKGWADNSASDNARAAKEWKIETALTFGIAENNCNHRRDPTDSTHCMECGCPVESVVTDEELRKMSDIIHKISATAPRWEHFGDNIKIALCCDDCPGRNTGTVFTVGDVRMIDKSVARRKETG